jgi:hypothetical protein
VVLGHQRLELAKALSDLLFGGAELIKNGHASRHERLTAVFTILREDLHNFGASLPSTPRTICVFGIGTAEITHSSALCTRRVKAPPVRPAALREPAPGLLAASALVCLISVSAPYGSGYHGTYKWAPFCDITATTRYARGSTRWSRRGQRLTEALIEVIAPLEGDREIAVAHLRGRRILRVLKR